MKCPRCQAENPAGMRFCGQCAAPLASVCASCGANNPSENKFCGQCAAPLGKSAEPRFASPESYTPRHLAEKILTSKAALEGERKQVTVLFADLKGSMELLADRDPEEARKILDPVLERMMEAVHRYEGTVNQVMGDGIMALFGAPVAHEDHAVRACYGALRMQRRVSLYADEIQRAGGTPVQIRVGLNSGEVVVRSIGSDLHMDYTAVGQTTHLAARMEQMAKPGSVLVTGETLKLAEGYFQVRPLGPITVKGLASAIAAYELTGIGPARSRLQASAARGLTRFVGRESELQQLAQALERTAVGHGQTVAVVGEAGVGKSRLLWEFTRSHRTHGWLLLESGSVSYGKATPYLPVIELLKAYFRIQDRDDQREIRERVAGKLLMLDRALEPLLTPLLTLLDVPIADAPWEALDPPQRRQRTLEAVKRLLLRESQVQPLLLIFEDLHWIDSETQSLLDGLIESLPTARVLLLVNYRPEYQHAWGHKSYYLQLRIDPLPRESAEELLSALLGEDRALEPLKRLLVERTEGNPFFLEESVRTLVETEMLVGERGTYRIAKAPEQWQIPATAQAILAARIDRLGPEDKRLLQAASVIGKDVPFSLLQIIADVSEDNLRQGLTHLQGAEFLYETSLFPDLEYTFKHALTHEVAYGSVLQERRRTLHARIVEGVERLHSDRLAEHVDRLAHHAFRGEVWGKAVTYLRQAGTRAFARSTFREAAACFELALAAMLHLEPSRARTEVSVSLRFDLRNALIPLGEHRRIVDQLDEAAQAAEAANDRHRLGWVLAYSSISLCHLERLEEAVSVGERAVALAAGLGDVGLDVLANFFVGVAECLRGSYGRAIERLRRNVDLLEGDRTWERFGEPGLPSVFSRAILAWCLAERGEFAEAVAHGVKALKIAEAVDQPFTFSHACLGLGIAHLGQGHLREATAVLERGVQVCRAADIQIPLPLIGGALGSAYVLGGHPEKAVSVLEPLVEQDASRPVLAGRSLRIGYLSDACRELGRLEDAVDLAARGLSLAREDKERGSEAHALRTVADVLARKASAEFGQAEVHYRDALSLAQDLGMRPLVAHCHVGLARMYRRAGKQIAAREHLTRATILYRDLDMRLWLDMVDTEIQN